MQRLLNLVLLPLLVGCGSSGGGGAETDRTDAANTLAANLLSTNVSAPAELPKSGSARYEGFMTAGLPTGAGGGRKDYLGDLVMTVDFAAAKDQVTGRASGFAAGQDALAGALRISKGDLFRNTVVDENYTFTGDVDGTLKHSTGSYAIDAEINGEFRGRNQDGVSGVLFGDVEGPMGQDIFDGDFFAAKP